MFKLQKFFVMFHRVFEEYGGVFSAALLLCLCQGHSTVGEYAIQLCTLAPELSWNNKALMATFWEGLANRTKDELAGRDLSTSMDGPITRYHCCHMHQYLVC